MAARLPRRLPRQQPPEPGRSRERFLPGGRGSGSCNSGGRFLRERRAAPASGGGAVPANARFLPDGPGRMRSASVGRFLRRSRAATGRTTLGCCTTLVRMLPMPPRNFSRIEIPGRYCDRRQEVLTCVCVCRVLCTRALRCVEWKRTR